MIDPSGIGDIGAAIGGAFGFASVCVSAWIKRKQGRIETEVKRNEARLTDHDDDLRPLLQLVVSLEKDSRDCNERVSRMIKRLNMHDTTLPPDESETRLRRDLAEILERRVMQREASEQS